MVRNGSFEPGIEIKNAWKRVCETLFIALFSATLHDLMFNSGSSMPMPLEMFIGGVFSSTIVVTVQVSLFN